MEGNIYYYEEETDKIIEVPKNDVSIYCYGNSNEEIQYIARNLHYLGYLKYRDTNTFNEDEDIDYFSGIRAKALNVNYRSIVNYKRNEYGNDLLYAIKLYKLDKYDIHMNIDYFDYYHKIDINLMHDICMDTVNKYFHYHSCCEYDENEKEIKGITNINSVSDNVSFNYLTIQLKSSSAKRIVIENIIKAKDNTDSDQKEDEDIVKDIIEKMKQSLDCPLTLMDFNRLNSLNIDKDNVELSWDEYYMGIANLVKCRSKDPVTKVGACLVLDNKIISTGYNGFPRNLSNDKYPWTKDSKEDETKNKFFYVVHAELNAILNSPISPNGSTLYVTKFPCNECTKAIIQSGIKKVIYIEKDDPNFAEKKHSVTRDMLIDAGVELEKYTHTYKRILITT